MKLIRRDIIGLLLLTALAARASTYTWNNPAGGDWAAQSNWSPVGIPQSNDTANITLPGTYSVTMTTSTLAGNLNISTSSGSPTLLVENGATLTLVGAAGVYNSGTLVLSNGSLAGNLSVAPGGELVLTGAATIFLYSANITNLGTVLWQSGGLYLGGTTITNGGLWLITGDNSSTFASGSTPVFVNGGTVRKSGGVASSYLGGFNFTNLPGALVDVLTGTLAISGASCSLGGSFSATAPGVLSFSTGTWFEAGASASGTGMVELFSGILNLRTNNIPGLTFEGGDVYILGGNTFQKAGAITNLTLDGATLHGSNQVAGVLTLNSGNLVDQLTVQSNGQLNLNTFATKFLYSAAIINQGTVNWAGGNLYCGGVPATVISNTGQWLMTGDNNAAYITGNTPVFVNNGVVRKSAGVANSTLSGFNFTNQSTGLVEVDSGTIQLPAGAVNQSGTWLLNGGTLSSLGTLAFIGGLLDGTGSVGANSLTGGVISPGQSGAGLLTFASGLNFGAGATLSIDGVGANPGTQYDQLSVTGSVALNGATLQVTSLPGVTPGAAFVIITNTANSAVSGTFNNLPENALITVSGQLFRIHYAGGRGYDVRLVREGYSQLYPTNGLGQFSGAGTPSVIHAIQATADLMTWTNIGSATGNSNGAFNFVDTNAHLFNHRFYRVVN